VPELIYLGVALFAFAITSELVGIYRKRKTDRERIRQLYTPRHPSQWDNK